MASFNTLDQVDVAGKRVLLRLDLNVPTQDGTVTDHTRLERVCPTLRELSDKHARVIVLSHFDRPYGRRDPDKSLLPVSRALRDVLGREDREDGLARRGINIPHARVLQVGMGGDRDVGG